MVLEVVFAMANPEMIHVPYVFRSFVFRLSVLNRDCGKITWHVRFMLPEWNQYQPDRPSHTCKYQYISHQGNKICCLEIM
jgi:hypothetical protein